MHLHIYIILNDAERDDTDRLSLSTTESWQRTWKVQKIAYGMLGCAPPPNLSTRTPLTILEVITPCVVYKHVKNKQWPWADSTLQNNFKACSVV